MGRLKDDEEVDFITKCCADCKIDFGIGFGIKVEANVGADLYSANLAWMMLPILVKISIM